MVLLVLLLVELLFVVLLVLLVVLLMLISSANSFLEFFFELSIPLTSLHNRLQALSRKAAFGFAIIELGS